MERKVDFARDTALKILKEVNHDGKYANMSLKQHLRRARFNDRDAAFITQLVYGTLERQLTIDWILGMFCKSKVTNPWVVNILRMGCYQIVHMDRVPDSAVCNESVKLCKKYANKTLAGFVNGVLRNIVRNKEKIEVPSKETDIAEYLRLTYSYPAWLVKKWIEDYGGDTAVKMLMPAGNDDYITIRVNRCRTSKDELKLLLADMGIEAEDGLFMQAEALRIGSVGDIERNRLYREGLFTVQGESSMLVVHLLDPQMDEFILDACSAPGGKATHLAERMGNRGKILAWDVHPQRVDALKRNVQRMGAVIVEPQLQDASSFQADLKERFDRVLIDAPCSGWGVIHKKPDIKNRITMDGLPALYDVQRRIITNCSRYVKTGGVLVYSTCTMNIDENQGVVEAFLNDNPLFEPDDFSDLLPEKLNDSIVKAGMIQLIPSRDGVDGFFIARLRRTG